MCQGNHFVFEVNSRFLSRILLKIQKHHLIELVLDDFDEIRHILVAGKEFDQLLSKKEVLVAKLIECFSSGHRIAFLDLVNIPEGEDKCKVHEQHALLAKVLYLNVGISWVSVKNHLNHLDFIFGMVADRADHLVVAFTVVVANEDFQKSYVCVDHFEQSIDVRVQVN